MNLKRTIIFVCLFICLFSISNVFADDNNTIISNDDLALADTQYTIEISSEDQLNENKTVGTFTDLADKINDGNNEIILEHDYEFDSSTDSNYEYGIVIDKKITIDGNNFTINAKNQARIFNVSKDYVIFKNIKFINAYDARSTVYSQGAAINGDNYDSFLVEYCTFNNNYAIDGGAVCGGTIKNSIFVNNSALKEGGAILRSEIEDCTFINNKADFGAISYSSANRCIFINNSAFRRGGAAKTSSCYNSIFINNTSINAGALYEPYKVVNCTFINNTADVGGAVWYGGSIFNSTFINNSARFVGGALCHISAFNSIFINNIANVGGAISNYDWKDDIPVVDNCTFYSNHAREYGGAVNYAIINNSKFENNTATNASAVYNSNITNSTFKYNKAIDGGTTYSCNVSTSLFDKNIANNGGAMYNGYSINNTFKNNAAQNEGGAAYNVYAINSIFENNNAKSSGGAISNSRATNSTFINNSAEKYGGAAYNSKISKNSKLLNNKDSNGKDIINTTLFELGKNFKDLYKLVVNSSGKTIYLNDNYTFNLQADLDFKNGILLNGDVIVEGNNFTIDGFGEAYGFNISSAHVTFKNIHFTNLYSKFNRDYNDYYFGNHLPDLSNGSCTIVNCLFTDSYGGIPFFDNAIMINSTFINNDGRIIYKGSAINCTFDRNYFGYFLGEGNIINCIFTNNNKTSLRSVNVTNSTFINNTGLYDGIVEHADIIINSIFINNSANGDGGAVKGVGSAFNCIFINNTARNGGAADGGKFINSTFINNHATEFGGAIWSSSSGSYYNDGNNSYDHIYHTTVNCIFINNTADELGGALYRANALNCTFNNNYAPVGQVIMKGSLQNCTFINNKISTNIFPEDTIKTYTGNTNVLGVLKALNGDILKNCKVDVKFEDGSKRTVTTNSKGEIKLEMINIKPKSYSVTLEFSGNKKYDNTFDCVVFKVLKSSSKIIASKKTFKVKTKTKKYSVTLKTNSNIGIKNVKVTIKVKGKTYTAKTNAKGKATFKLTKLTKKGKYAATVKYAGSKYYAKSAKKVKITVK